MSKLADKMKANLESMKLVPHKAAIAELNAKADAMEAAGHKGEHTELKRRIFDELVKIMPGEVVWMDSEFHRGELTIEEYTGYSKERDIDGNYATKLEPCMHYGWRGGDFKFSGKLLSGFYANVDYKQTYEQTGSWRRNGKPLGVRIYVGDYGSKEQFKQMKDGTHRYADIAALIKCRAESHKLQIKAAIQAAKNKDAVTEVKVGIDQEFKDYNGVVVTASSNVNAPVTIKLDATRTMTTEAAIELLNVLKKHGLG